MSSSSSKPTTCMACKSLRLECKLGCVYAANFPADKPLMFLYVFMMFSEGFVRKLLEYIAPAYQRSVIEILAHRAEFLINNLVNDPRGYTYKLQQHVNYQLNLVYYYQMAGQHRPVMKPQQYYAYYLQPPLHGVGLKPQQYYAYYLQQPLHGVLGQHHVMKPQQYYAYYLQQPLHGASPPIPVPASSYLDMGANSWIWEQTQQQLEQEEQQRLSKYYGWY